MSRQNSLKRKNIKDNPCDHEEELEKRKKSKESYFYCYKCNNIFLIDQDKYYCANKYIDEDKDLCEEIEFDPVITVKNKIERQEEQIKEINEQLILNFFIRRKIIIENLFYYSLKIQI